MLDQGVWCQTVNVLDATYPLRLADGRPSASTRAIAAGGRAIWLHGSDAGLARVTDALAPGHCPPDGVVVTYAPVLRREDGVLPANAVPALLAAADGALWVGSALGLSRVQHGQVTPVPFDPALSFRGQPATLEAQTLAPVVVTTGASQAPVDVVQGSQVLFPLVPGATLDMPAGVAQFPVGLPTELRLTLLSPHTLATPLPRGFTAVAAADFAVDVRSENDYGPAAERAMRDKRADYFACGTLVVWDVDVQSADVIKSYKASDPDNPVTFRWGHGGCGTGGTGLADAS